MYMLEKIYFIVSGSGRIIGGRPKLDRESPNTWQVARVKREKNSILPHVFCGGVLLSKKYILSAAHCGPPTTGKDKVLIGAKAKYEVDKIRPLSHKYHTHDKHQIFHSATHGPFTVYDFMILILKAPFHACVSDFVRLPKKSDDDNLLGTPLLAVGWGSILPATHEQILRDILGAPKKYPDRMQEVELFYLPIETCQERWQEVFNVYGSARGTKPGNPNYVSEYVAEEIRFDSEPGTSMFCASGCSETDLELCTDENLKGMCHGDSGCKF